jgi:hypothetical protein
VTRVFCCQAALNAPTVQNNVSAIETTQQTTKAKLMKHYSAPTVTVVGSVTDLTQNLNKVGLAKDAASEAVPGLNGSIIPD